MSPRAEGPAREAGPVSDGKPAARPAGRCPARRFAQERSEIHGTGGRHVHSLRQQGDLQRRLGQFKTFLPRPVISVLAGMAGKDVEEFLRPRQATVTVLFCDIRGSCRIAEQGQNDLMRLWDHVCAPWAS